MTFTIQQLSRYTTLPPTDVEMMEKAVMLRYVAALAACICVVACTCSEGQNVPALIRFNATAIDESRTPISTPTGATFAIYKDEYGGSPLWIETQSISPDSAGHYSVVLGENTKGGISVSVFESGESRWLGISYNGAPEQGRVLLVSVPYAIKAGDAATLGGMPPSAFVLAAPVADADPSSSKPLSASSTTGIAVNTVTGTILTNYIPLFADSSGTLTDSIMFQGSGRIGINTATPASTFDVTDTQPELRMSSTSGTSIPQISFYDGSSLGGFFQYRNHLASAPNLFRLGGWASGSQFAIVTAATERVRVDASGNVGIATSTPGARLDIFGNGGSLLSMKTSGVQKFGVDASGNTSIAGNATISGNAGVSGTLSGNGSGLTNLNSASLSGPVGVTKGGTGLSGVAGAGLFLRSSGANAWAASNLQAGDVPNAAVTNDLRTRIITYVAGCDSCAVLGTSDSENSIFVDEYSSLTINSVACYSDSGAPQLNVQRNSGGTLSNILATALTCSSSGASEAASATLLSGDQLNLVITSVDGVAKRATVVINAILN